MTLSVIIVNYHTPALLKLCLKSLKTALKDIIQEIIVVDNDSQEDSQMLIREDYPGIVFLPLKKNVGYARAVNKGLKRVKGEYLLILNPDIIVSDEKAIPEMLDFMKSHPQIGILGPKLINFNHTPQYSCFRFYTPRVILYRRTFLGSLPFAQKTIDWFVMKDVVHPNCHCEEGAPSLFAKSEGATDETISRDDKGIASSLPRLRRLADGGVAPRNDRPEVEVDWLMGSALLVRKKALEKVGPLDERFFVYFEDVDWCRRFWENGYKVVYLPKTKMFHYHQRLSANQGIFSKAAWIHIVSAIKYFWKYGFSNSSS